MQSRMLQLFNEVLWFSQGGEMEKDRTKGVPGSASEMRAALDEIIKRRMQDAAHSAYDVSVCVRSVAAAREVIEAIPVRGTAAAYGGRAYTAINRLAGHYRDPDGEYTSKGLIGDVALDIHLLLNRPQEE